MVQQSPKVHDLQIDVYVHDDDWHYSPIICLNLKKLETKLCCCAACLYAPIYLTSQVELFPTQDDELTLCPTVARDIHSLILILRD